jgi:LacI family transcriptional regulator
MSHATPPTALVTANNAMTIGALRALREHGLSVPHDIALCCFDDFAWADLFSPRLTAIAQPSREIGAEAVRVLLERLAAPVGAEAVRVLLERLAAPDRAARTVRLPCAFVHRSSCGCPEENGAAAAARSRPAWSTDSRQRSARSRPAPPSGQPDHPQHPGCSGHHEHSGCPEEGTLS